MVNKEKNFISVVIYVHNSEKRIATFFDMVMNTVKENFEAAEIICVNDFSDDGSVETIRKLGGMTEGIVISILNLSYFHGLEAAMNAGVDLAIGDFVLEFDNTNQDFATEEIMKAYHCALEGYDVVSMSPNKRQRFSSYIFYCLFNKFGNQPYRMNTESFRIVSRRVINQVNSMNVSVPYRKAVYANCGLKAVNLKYNEIENQNRKKTDKDEKKYRKGLAADTLILFTQVGYRVSIMMTVIMMLAMFFFGSYAVFSYVMKLTVAGWTSIVLFFAMAFFGLFLILTIIVKYLQIIVSLTFQRKSYSYESIEKLNG